MPLAVAHAIDSRQFPQWGKYLSGIGWTVEHINNTQIFIRKIPLLRRSLIKIQHPLEPIPYDEIEKLVKKYHAFSVIIEPHVTNFDQAEYKKHGYRPVKEFYAHSATIKIDVSQTTESLFKSFSENARRNIKKSQKHNITIKPIFLKDEIDDTQFKLYYQLMRNLIDMKKFYSPGYDEYEKKMNAFKDSSFLLFAYEGKTPIACVWYGYYKNVIVYLQTGITKRGYTLLANYLLVWEGMLLAQKMGIKVFDFESIYDVRYPKESRGWKKYTEFKKRFHGEIVEYPITQVKYYHPFFKFLGILSSIFS